MNMIRITALVAGVLFSHSAFAQCSGVFPANVACGTSVAGSPTAKSLPAIVGTQTANTVWAGPTTGSAAIPSFRALVAGDIPGSFSGFANPTATVGLSAVNGSATTAMRSDASPPLSSGVQTSLTGTNHGVLLGTGSVGFGATAVMTDGQILTGQSAANPLPKTMSGDATLAASGAITLASVISGGGPTGSATVAPIITWDAKGRLTVVSSATITPAIGSITGLGTGVATALGVNVGSAGAIVVNGGALGTPSSGVATNLTGTASGLTAGNVTTNANMTGDITSVGNATTIASHAVTNAKAAQMAASTIKGNPTTSTADASDFTIAGLTHKSSPATSDLLMLSDVSASNAYKYATIAEIIGSVSTGVTSFNGQTGAIVLGSITPQVRITLNTATPVMLTNYAAQTTVYVTPYVGNLIPIYDGTNMVPTPFAEVSQTTTDTTKSPAAVTTNANYDIFCWVDTGPTNRCTRGPVWTSLTARSAGTALVRVNGILLNSVSITNGPAASRGTYVGTISSDGSSQINWVFGAVAANCTAGNFAVWNMYNRIDVETFTGDSTASWTYAVSNTTREINGNTACAVSSVRGFDEDGVSAAYNGICLSGVTTTQMNGIGLNSTTTFVGSPGYCSSTALALVPRGEYSGLMGLGYNSFTANERQNTTTSSSWFGNPSGTLSQSAMHVRLKQ